MWRNTTAGYGLVHIFLHWLMALLLVGMFSLGLYMVGLSYYDTWYHRGPAIHKSVGLLLIPVYLFRLLWRYGNPRPHSLAAHRWMRLSAHLVHLLIYGVVFTLFISGYLIASADGRAIPVFDVFSVPALTLPIEQQEDLAGDIHQVLAWLLATLVLVHAAAALQHHFIHRDATLKRMLRPVGRRRDEVSYSR